MKNSGVSAVNDLNSEDGSEYEDTPVVERWNMKKAIVESRWLSRRCCLFGFLPAAVVVVGVITLLTVLAVRGDLKGVKSISVPKDGVSQVSFT